MLFGTNEYFERFVGVGGGVGRGAHIKDMSHMKDMVPLT